MRSPRWLPLTLCVLASLISPATGAAADAPVWLPAAGAAGASSTDIQVAHDSAGNAVAVWRKTYGGSDSVWSASMPQGATAFSGVKRISAAPASGETPEIADLTLAVDAQGGAIAAWTGRYTTGAEPYVFIARRSGGTWEAPQALFDGGSSTSPSLGFASTGVAVVAWRQTGGDYSQIRVSSVGIASGAVTAIQSVAPAANAAQPQLAFDGSGNGLLTWVETAVSFTAPYTGAVTLRVSSRKVGAATFTGAKLVYETRTSTIDDPAVAIDPQGNATIAWGNRLLDTHLSEGVYASTRAAGTTSWPGAAVSLTGVEPELAVSTAGGSVVTWVEPGIGTPVDTGAVMAAHRAPGVSNFAPGVALSALGEVGADPTVAAGSGGTTAVAWTRHQGAGDVPRAAVKAPAAGAFWPAEDLDLAGGSVGATAVAVNGLHDAVALWQPAGSASTLQRMARLDGSTVAAAPAPVVPTTPAPTTPIPTSPAPTTPTAPNPTTPVDPTTPTTPSEPTPTTPSEPTPTTPSAPSTPTPTTPSEPSPTTPSAPSTPTPTTPSSPSTPTTPSVPTPSVPVTPVATTPTRAPVVSVAKDPAVASKETAQSAAGTVATDLGLATLPSLRAFKALGAKRFKAAPRGDGLLARGDGLPLAATGNLPGTLRVVVTSTPKGGKAKNLKPAMSADVEAGTTKLVFTGRLAGKPLPAGLYKLKAVFTDEQGRASNRRELSIAIKR